MTTVVLKRDNSSCTMPGRDAMVRVAVKMDKGQILLSRISPEDGRELRNKAKLLGHELVTGVPSLWWHGVIPDLVEIWPWAAKDYTIMGESYGRGEGADAVIF